MIKTNTKKNIYSNLFLLTLTLTATKTYAQTSPTPYADQIIQIVSNSECAKYSWKNRGRAPAGYIKGLALSYARSVCRIKITDAPAAASILLRSPASGNSSKDALTYYQPEFNKLKITTNQAGVEAVQAIYTLGFGLGMRESSGKYCEGWDTSAGSNRKSDEGEAGLYQFSYNSISASPDLKSLYIEYLNSPNRCLLNVFQENVTCKSQTVLGTGSGAEFQKFVKQCPAFAAEYGMSLLRVLRKHFGPINRKEAEVKPVCEKVLTQISDLIESNPQVACEEIY